VIEKLHLARDRPLAPRGMGLRLWSSHFSCFAFGQRLREVTIDLVKVYPGDAAHLLSTHQGRIYQMIRDGELPVVKIGGVMRIRREDLERLLKKS
jgi:excisionase family DNA binding protein